MNRILRTLIGLFLVVAASGALWAWRPAALAKFREPARWQALASPGRLSSSHAFLELNCTACHTAVSGVEATKCIACHANNQNLLQRQTTAFHANVTSCRECHAEHQGTSVRPSNMNHVALSRLGLRQLAEATGTNRAPASRLLAYLQNQPQWDASYDEAPKLTAHEALLNCATCHRSRDRHVGLFGADCARCHATQSWKLADFRHPSPTSRDCAQCHQAPPSHYMMHFQMVSMTVAKQERAQVNECYLCHQTTSWNDIRGVGFYKHH